METLTIKETNETTTQLGVVDYAAALQRTMLSCTR